MAAFGPYNAVVRPVCQCHGESMYKSGRSWRCAVKRREQSRGRSSTARVRRWRQNNPEKYAAQQWRKNVARRGGPQSPGHAAAVANWIAKNPERQRLIKRINEQRRRARKRGASGCATVTQVLARFAFYGWQCVFCGTTDNLTIDHTIPLARGGSNYPANLRPACRSCNSRKWTRRG